VSVADQTGGVDSKQNELGDRAIAYYHWNVSLPNSGERLMVVKDYEGLELMPSARSGFDHKKDCSGNR